MRHSVSFQLTDVTGFKENALAWAARFREVIWLDGNSVPDTYSSFDALLAVDAVRILKQGHNGSFDALDAFQQELDDWIFGYLSYDLKNDIEALVSDQHDSLGFPELCFFQARKIIRLRGSLVDFMYITPSASSMAEDLEEIMGIKAENSPVPVSTTPLKIKMRVFKDEYFETVKTFQKHIGRGDIYEANYCQEFYAENARINPLKTFSKLNSLSLAPFSAFMRMGDFHLISASPERFLKKSGTRLISQPMKGTTGRSADPQEDMRLKARLGEDPKERSENIMIVDLVRNDLSKAALRGSVKVEELCKVYSFKQVHQMISTITANVSEYISPVEILRNAFPMGSMTGAPKVSAMKLIETYEATKRGVYSGAVGYIEPGGDFDFNVVIRSILYNSARKYVSYSVGSAITSRSRPEQEYGECLLKAKAMREVLEDAGEHGNIE